MINIKQAVLGVKGYFTGRRLNNLERDMKYIIKRNNVANNPLELIIQELKETNRDYTLKVQENSFWYQGIIKNLRSFYKATDLAGEDAQNFFWARAKAKNRKIHTGIPRLISETMARVIFSPGVTLDVEVFQKNKETGEVLDAKNEKASKNALEILTEILKDNRIKELNIEGATAESWGGGVAYKLSRKKSLTKFPILEIADVRNIELITDRRRIKGIIFKEWYQKKVNDWVKMPTINYVFHETYTTNEQGDSIIINELFEINTKGELIPKPLDTIPETSDIKEEVIKTGTKGMLAFYKVNKSGHSRMIDNPYGDSDYLGSYGAFDALDEVYSEIVEEVRRGKPIRYIPKEFLPKNSNGDILGYDEFNADYIALESSIDQYSKKEITSSKLEGRQVDLENKHNINLTTVLNNAGLSPLTIGITGLEAMTSSDKTQQERQRTTLATREAKCECWKEFLEIVYLKALELYSVMNADEDVLGLNGIDVDWSNCNVNVQFNRYIQDTVSERIATWGNAKQMGVASIETVVKNIHQDNMTKDQIDQEVERLKVEQNCSLDNPDRLLRDTEIKTKEEKNLEIKNE